MELYNFLKDFRVDRSGLPKWAISFVLEAIVAPPILFMLLGELLERAFSLEAPANRVVAGRLARSGATAR